MRRILLLILLIAPLAAHAANIRRVNVQEFEQILASVQHRSDGKAAKELAGINLTERVSAVRLARWEIQFPGKHCHEALTVLADASAFLDLPADEIPGNAPPDVQTQKEMLLKTIDYVNSALARLPDFYATRRTEHFQDTPSVQRSSNILLDVIGKTAYLAYEPLHAMGMTSNTISFVGGHELLGSKKNNDFYSKPAIELTTRGEFGPILIVVLLDAIKGSIRWGHWEQSANGANAVFRYSVRQGQSSYQVILPHGAVLDTVFPAYHGEIALDPATGAVLRITTVADLPAPDERAVSSIAVEYDSVSIGGRSYICPVRSIALARFVIGNPQATALTWQIQLNHVAFVDYHLFRSESRILTGNFVDHPAPPQ
jgi:hypothetical protein